MAEPAWTVWRITPARHAGHAFDGEGARLWGGRWNHPGTALIYCSSALSLAVLEYFVHLEPGLASGDLVAIPAEIPGSLERSDIHASSLPADWRTYPAPESVKDLGTVWVRSGRTAVLRVPSVVIPREANVLLDPAHPGFAKIRIGIPEPFSFDPRMWK